MQLLCMNECKNAHVYRVWLYSAECTEDSQENHSRLTVLLPALFHSRQMEGNITTACTIAFIKQNTETVLTVTSWERESFWRNQNYVLCIILKNETLSSCWCSACVLSLSNICVYFIFGKQRCDVNETGHDSNTILVIIRFPLKDDQ